MIQANKRAFFFAALIASAAFARPAFADEYHNINGFFGERSAGLGGAYAAISDDPSGSYYNPAGIVFAYDNFISLSASNFRESKKTYESVFGPGQSYSRTSRSYLPNFFGAIKHFDSFKFGFSVVSPSTDDYDQADQITLPNSIPTVFNYRNDYTEKNTSILLGPTFAKKIADKMSAGITVYFLYDSRRITTTQFVSRKDNTYSSTDISDRRTTTGVNPVLGWQWMPKDFLSLGLSLRRPLILSESRRRGGIFNNSSPTASGVTILESTQRASGAANGGSWIAGPGDTGSLPQTWELRSGFALFPSRYLMMAFDIIHTTGYKKEIDRTQVDARNGNIFLNSPEVQELTRKPTTNFAFGTEYYMSDNLALRGGLFTNYSNSYSFHWGDRAAAAVAQNAGITSVSGLTPIGSSVIYNVPALAAMNRFEAVDTKGLSLGMSWSDATSSITFTYVHEFGKGTSQIDPGQAPQRLIYRSSSFYIVASTRT